MTEDCEKQELDDGNQHNLNEANKSGIDDEEV